MKNMYRIKYTRDGRYYPYANVVARTKFGAERILQDRYPNAIIIEIKKMS